MRLILARHGETEYNLQQRFQGHTDIPLSRAGLEQARVMARALAKEDLAAVIASDLTRARGTADAIAGSRGLTVQIEPGLRECGYGHWEGLTRAEVRSRYPEEFDAWVQKAETAPEGESYEAVRQRVLGARDRILASYVGVGVVAVSHAGALKQLIGGSLGLDCVEARRIRVDQGSLSELEWSEERGWVLCYLNRPC